VLEEALHPSTAFVISYHPPIFKPLCSLTPANPPQASLLKLAAMSMSVTAHPLLLILPEAGSTISWQVVSVYEVHLAPVSTESTGCGRERDGTEGNLGLPSSQSGITRLLYHVTLAREAVGSPSQDAVYRDDWSLTLRRRSPRAE
ncbi:hypothetical protein F5J12DRAFT_717904, partial [Pisolithus orientalis]|uniref:uncharacterized protein n=1 Tax=Pisolithus orientalis TaxID=936130 RepID=UPI002225A7BE